MVVIKKILFNYKSVQLWDSQNFPDSKKKVYFIASAQLFREEKAMYTYLKYLSQ